MTRHSIIERAALVLALVCLATAVFAQSATPPVSPGKTPSPSGVATASTTPPPEYSDLDKADLQIMALHNTIKDLSDQLGQCRAQLAPLVSARIASEIPRLQNETIARIESRHPGYRLNRETGDLVPIEKASAPEKK